MVLVYRRAFFMFVLIASLFTPAAGRGAEVDDLKATFEQEIAALNKHDLEAFAATCHDQIVAFGASSPFPADGKTAIRQGLQNSFANNESHTFKPINPQFRVLGTTGIVWGHIMEAVKPKDGPMRTTFGRLLNTFTKVDGKWLLVAVHISRIPSGD